MSSTTTSTTTTTMIRKSTKVIHQHLMILLAIALMVAGDSALRASGQSINVRVNGETDKPTETSGQPRATFQKPLFPHRIMHFGKRQPLSRYNYGLTPPSDGGMNQIESQLFPNSLVPMMDRDNTKNSNNRYYADRPSSLDAELIQVPNEIQNDEALFLTGNRYYQLLPTYDSMRQKNQRLMLNSEPTATLSSLGDNQQQSQAEPSFVNVQTRSVANGAGGNGQRASAFNLNRPLISTGYGRQGSDIQSIGVYNKKAEPVDNFYMHFG